jgi:hypothetical protein
MYILSTRLELDVRLERVTNIARFGMKITMVVKNLTFLIYAKWFLECDDFAPRGGVSVTGPCLFACIGSSPCLGAELVRPRFGRGIRC